MLFDAALRDHERLLALDRNLPDQSFRLSMLGPYHALHDLGFGLHRGRAHSHPTHRNPPEGISWRLKRIEDNALLPQVNDDPHMRSDCAIRLQSRR
jgi:hypothetical protein